MLAGIYRPSDNHRRVYCLPANFPLGARGANCAINYTTHADVYAMIIYNVINWPAPATWETFVYIFALKTLSGSTELYTQHTAVRFFLFFSSSCMYIILVTSRFGNAVIHHIVFLIYYTEVSSLALHVRLFTPTLYIYISARFPRCLHFACVAGRRTLSPPPLLQWSRLSIARSVIERLDA